MLMSNRNQPARVHYMANGFRVLSGGNYVVCAHTGEEIPLETLRYWSVTRQEPYATAETAAAALTGK